MLSVTSVEPRCSTRLGCSSMAAPRASWFSLNLVSRAGISKRGDKSLRCLLVQCARVYKQRLDSQKGALADWVRSLLQRRHSNVVACDLVNKLAQIAWAISAHHTVFEAGSDAMAAWPYCCCSATRHLQVLR